MAAPSHNPVLARAGFGVEVQTAGASITLAGTSTKSLLLPALIGLGMVYTWLGMPGIGLTPALIYPLLTES